MRDRNPVRLPALLLAAIVLHSCDNSDGDCPPTPTPAFALSTTALNFTGTLGGPDPSDQNVVLSNTGDPDSVLNWTVTSDRAWLSVLPTSGSNETSVATSLAVQVTIAVQSESWLGSTSTSGAPPSGATGHGEGVWTGSAMLIWGESHGQTGTFYDPLSNTWSGSTSLLGAPSGRSHFTSVWTGSEMIVWGGFLLSGGTPLNTGGRYNLATNTWSTVSTVNGPDSRFAHSAVWTGSRMIVWGGESGGFSYKNSGGIYNPSTDTWESATNVADAPSVRGHHTAVWTGTHMLIWGGEDPDKFNAGYFFDPATDSWTGETTTVGAPSARSHHSSVWTGSEMIVWGGGEGGAHLATGARYNPLDDAWTASTPTSGAPDGRASHVAVWTGTSMIVWGGEVNGPLVNTGGIYAAPIPSEGTNRGTLTFTAAGASNSPRTITVDLTAAP